MTCDQCGKKTAIILFTQIVHNEKTVLRLCEDCAKAKGLSISTKGEVSPAAGLIVKALKEAITSKDKHLVCPVCGTSYAIFKQGGRLGCGTCYEMFSTQLSVLFRRIHGHDRHTGKTPKGQSLEEVRVRREIFALRERLQRAVEEEAFEEAAQLRDRIARMEQTEWPEFPNLPKLKNPGNVGSS